jgi:hypothetical protein
MVLRRGWAKVRRVGDYIDALWEHGVTVTLKAAGGVVAAVAFVVTQDLSTVVFWFACFLVVAYLVGSFRAWDNADTRAAKAQLALEAEDSREALVRRLAGYRDEYLSVREQIAPAAADYPVLNELTHHLDTLNANVRSDLLRHEPARVAGWAKVMPPEFRPGLPDQVTSRHQFIDLHVATLDRFIEELGG